MVIVMIVKNYRNWFLWIAGVAVAAAAIGFLMPSAPMNTNKNLSHTVVTARGQTAVSNKASNPSTQTQQTAKETSAADTAATEAKAPEAQTAVTAPETKVAPKVETVSFLKLKTLLEKEPQTIKGMVFESGSLTVKVKRQDGSELIVTAPDADARVELRKQADQLKIEYDVVTPPPAPVKPVESSGGWGGWSSILTMFGVMLAVSLVIMFIQRKMAGGMGGGGGGLSNFNKSKGKDVTALGDRADKVTFDDVAGCDEAVVELRRVVQTLSDRGIYADFDGELPKGILLLGPPGTGKTLLAKAVASESKGTMKALAGSDFVEMLVGVGAARVRDEFNLARETVDKTGKPYVIFIDEFDAIGGKRGNGVNSNQERENTLNALLVEMDGVHTNKGILIIAATNRADMLDDALLRPGRFDAHISVDLPDIVGREKIFAIHTRKKKLNKEVSHAILAQRTFGYSGAEIKGACNRAAIVAAERWIAAAAKMKEEGKTAEQIAAELPKELILNDFDDGIDFVRLGAAKTGSQSRMSMDEKLNTTYHEGGHALVAAVLKGADPVVKITIMRRSRALGYVQYMPAADRLSYTDEQAIARIICAMAGRAAQEVYLNKVDTGASNDFEQASDLAYKMVTKWGMSRVGRVSVGGRGAGIGSYGGGGELPFGQDLANEIDREWRRIVDECYKIARYIVETEKVRMEALVQELIKDETMLAPRWKAFLEEHPSAVDLEKVQFNPAAK